MSDTELCDVSISGMLRTQREYYEAKLAKAVEALEFYADGEWPQDYPGGVLYASGDDPTEFKAYLDYGDKARTTLAELKGEK
jgi:hypothetical protein